MDLQKTFFFFQKSGSGVFFSHVLHFVYELYWQEENFKRVNSQQLERTENHGCFWNKCFCGSLGTADCTSAGWSLLQCGAQQVNHTEITHLALFLSVRAIPALFLLLVLCVTLTERPLILPNTFCPSEIFFFFFLTELKTCEEIGFWWTEKAFFLLLKSVTGSTESLPWDTNMRFPGYDPN